MFHSPPIYKASITLSFKPKEQKAAVARAGEKRKPITFSGSGRGAGEGPGGKKRQERQLYMDVVGGRGGERARPGNSPSNYRPGKTVRPSGHYAPPGGKFSSKLARRSSWSKD